MGQRGYGGEVRDENENEGEGKDRAEGMMEKGMNGK